MKAYQEDLALLLAQSGALFFKDGLKLKDGRPTPYFVNFGFFKTGRLIADLGRIMAEFLVDSNLIEGFDVLVGPSYKGSALAVATAQALWLNRQIDKGFDYDRKESKTHGEASGQGAKFVTGALYNGARLMIIDDVVTTMATKFELLEQLAGEAENKGHEYNPGGVALFMDRQQTTAVNGPAGKPILGKRGDNAIEMFTQKTKLPVWVVLGIKETVQFLADKKEPVRQNNELKPLDQEALKQLADYWAVYGI